MNAGESPWIQVNIGSGNEFVLSGNKQIHEPVLPRISAAILRLLTKNELSTTHRNILNVLLAS